MTIDSSGVRKTQIPVRDCGSFDMRIAKDGTWYYQNSPIGRKPLVKLFASVLRREGERYYLVTPVERGTIEVEDAPFIIIAMETIGSGIEQKISFTTNLDETIPLDCHHPLTVKTLDNGEPRPYVLVREGLTGLINRAVFYELVEHGCYSQARTTNEASEINKSGEATEATEAGEKFGLWSHGEFFALE